MQISWKGVRLHRTRDRSVSIFDRSSVYALFIMSELFEKNNDGRGIEVWDKKKKVLSLEGRHLWFKEGCLTFR